MNSRTTVVLLVILVLAAAGVYFGVVQVQSPEALGTATPYPTAEPGPVPLFNGVPPEQITRFRVQRPALGQSLTLMRGTDGTWQITEAQGVTLTIGLTNTLSVPTPADDARVAGVLSQLTSLTPSRVYNQDTDVELFGLNAPSAVIEFTATSGITGTQQYVLKIGKEPFTNAGYFAQREVAPPAYLVNTYFVTQIFDLFGQAPLRPTPTPAPTITPTLSLTTTPFAVTVTVTPAP